MKHCSCKLVLFIALAAAHSVSKASEPDEQAAGDGGPLSLLPVVVHEGVPAPDILVRATAQVRRHLRQARAELGAAPAPAAQAVPLVTRMHCAAVAPKLGAMSCSLVTEISGWPEGCECRLTATTCPPADIKLGFTGLTPSLSVSLPEMQGLTVILCMYWQWLPSAGGGGVPPGAPAPAPALALAPMPGAQAPLSPAPMPVPPPGVAAAPLSETSLAAGEETKRMAQEYVMAAHEYAAEAGRKAVEPLWKKLEPKPVYVTAPQPIDIESFTRPPPIYR